MQLSAWDGEIGPSQSGSDIKIYAHLKKDEKGRGGPDFQYFMFPLKPFMMTQNDTRATLCVCAYDETKCKH